MGVLGEYERGTIVVVREPENAPTARSGPQTVLIKRVIGQPGDHVRIEEGEVLVNGHQVDQSYITASGEITRSHQLRHCH